MQQNSPTKEKQAGGNMPKQKDAEKHLIKGAKKISAEELFGGKEKLEEFNKKMEKVNRDFIRKQAQSREDASKVIINC